MVQVPVFNYIQDGNEKDCVKGGGKGLEVGGDSLDSGVRE